MILRNKLTKETLNISHAEFRAMFSKEEWFSSPYGVRYF